MPGDKIDETPSMKDGIDRDTESELRVFGCELIQTSGILLKLPQVSRDFSVVLWPAYPYPYQIESRESPGFLLEIANVFG